MVNSYWHTAVDGLQHLKEGLEGFCDDVIKQQHGRFKKYCRGNCTECELKTLKPNHFCDKKNNCPLGQRRCNCQNQSLRPCPNETCSIIYDEIIKDHGSSPPSPNWNNTDITQWYTNPWAIAVCFIKGTGYAVRKCAAEFDCSGLLSVIINNKAFLAHLQCNIDGNDAFTKAITIRNKLIHSPTMEIKKEQANKYIDDMIAVLEDRMELLRREESRAAVQKLKDLKKRNYHTEVDDKKINDVLRKTEKDPYIAIQYITELLSEGIKSMYKDSDEKEDSTWSELLTKIQNDQTVTYALGLLIEYWKIVLGKKDIKESIGDKIAEDSELLHAAEDEIPVDQTNALRLLTAYFGKWSSDLKQLHMKVVRGTVEASKKYEMPTIDRPHDGRLITLSRDELNGLLHNCESGAARKGGFGKVYVSKKKVPGLDIRVAIKKVDCQEEQIDHVVKMLSASNEKIASRVMHFAIVPLIAYMDEELGQNNRVFYFLSPFLERGNLLELIAQDKQSRGNIQLRHYKRIEILFQIASALDFLHTPVPNSRGIILHMDLTSTNIVLDNALNARVIDFGLAREMKEAQDKIKTQSTRLGTVGYYPTESHSSLTVHEDYFNYGVVVRELLTGEPPIKKDGNGYMQLKKLEEKFLKKKIQRNIWTGDSGKALILAELSTYCLNSKEKRYSSVDILGTLKNLHTRSADFTDPNEKKCHTCMVNEAAEGVHSPPHGCRMNVCVSCMRNSHINPIKCPLCNECVVPKIGHTFAALLIAGNDLENKDLAKSFKDDVEEINNVLVSKYPCAIGIREENVKVITPSDPGKPEKLLPRLSEAMYYLKSKEDLETLLVYFTGHHFTESGFKLGGNSDILTLQQLQEDLKKISQKWGNETRILVFLDCCNPPSVAANEAVPIPELSNKYIKIIQVNACRPDETFTQPISGSNFQKFFIQALTRRSFNKQCYNDIVGHEKPENVCKDCEMSGDFITVERLLKYISDHMSKSLSGKQPVMYANGITWLDASIGYNVDFDVNLKLKFGGPNLEKDLHLPHQTFKDIKELKKSILEKVIVDMRRSTRKRKAPANFEPDAVAVPPQPAPAPQQAPLPQQAPMMPQPVPVPQPAPVLPQPAPAPRPDPMVPLPEAVVPAPVGPVGNEHPQEVLDQADGKQQLQVKLTPVEFSDAIALQIHTGSQSQGGLELCSMLDVASAMNGKREIVASYRPVTNILTGRVVLFDNTESIFQYLERKGSLENTDDGRKIATLSFHDLDSVTTDPMEMENLIHTNLLRVEEKWRGEENRENKELKIIFPCLQDHKFHDFMVLDLHEKPGN